MDRNAETLREIRLSLASTNQRLRRLLGSQDSLVPVDDQAGKESKPETEVRP